MRIEPENHKKILLSVLNNTKRSNKYLVHVKKRARVERKGKQTKITKRKKKQISKREQKMLVFLLLCFAMEKGFYCMHCK